MKLNIDDLGVVGIVVDDWDITKSFKPKTITTDYSSWIAYISRRPVPAGIPITDTYYWKPLTRLQVDLALDYNNFKDAMTEEFKRLEQLVTSFLKSTEAGVAVTDSFGDNSLIAVSQRAQTIAFNKIWEKLESITGEFLQGINMVVTPTYFVSEDGCTLHVAANTVEANGVFEKIQFFMNNELIYEGSNTEYVSFDYHLENKPVYDYVVMCKAKIMGIEYTCQQLVTKYNEFFIGAGNTYSDVMDSVHAKQLHGTMRHNYDVTFADGQKLVIVMGEGLRPGFIRADLNGAEIELTEDTVTVDGKQYVVFTSEAWSAGDYNIDING